MSDEPLHLSVDLERGSEPIAGRVEEPGGDAHRFQGYMELIATLEALRGPAPTPMSRRPQRTSRGGPCG